MVACGVSERVRKSLYVCMCVRVCVLYCICLRAARSSDSAPPYRQVKRADISWPPPV
jgi:hypothetical protein